MIWIAPTATCPTTTMPYHSPGSVASAAVAPSNVTLYDLDVATRGLDALSWLDEAAAWRVIIVARNHSVSLMKAALARSGVTVAALDRATALLEHGELEWLAEREASEREFEREFAFGAAVDEASAAACWTFSCASFASNSWISRSRDAIFQGYLKLVDAKRKR